MSLTGLFIQKETQDFREALGDRLEGGLTKDLFEAVPAHCTGF